MREDIFFESEIEEKPIFSPQTLIKEIPISQENADFVRKSRIEICNILERKDKRFLLIAGPCSIHDTKAAFEYAEKLALLAKKYSGFFYIIMRTYFEKPRTALGWRGLITEPEVDGITNLEEGLKKARRFLVKITELKLPAACEFLNPVIHQYISDFISWASIGARSAESQIHRELVSSLPMPTGFKNTTGGDILPAINGIVTAKKPHSFIGVSKSGSVSVINTKGNKKAHLVLRGSANRQNSDASSILQACKLLRINSITPDILIDCSHGNSGKKPAKQSEVFLNTLKLRLRGKKDFEAIRGCMIESFIMNGSVEPEKCKLAEEYGRSITDPCMSLSEFENLLEKAYRKYFPFFKNIM